MKDIQIGIIGGAGGIGRWFGDLFRTEGYVVHASGRTSGLSLSEMAAICSVVIIGVPINATGDVIRQVGPCMRSDCLLMDLTSLKEEPVRDMLACSASEVIGCHPLFGPDVPSLAGQNVVICPARGSRWLRWLTELLEGKGGRIVLSTPQHHDEMMAAIQALIHINTIALGLTLRKTGLNPEELDRFSTPVFRTRMQHLEKVFEVNPGLYADIIVKNKKSRSIINRYKDTVDTLMEMVVKGDRAGLIGWMETDRKE
jgi:prephenate dehydrogenase